MNDATHVIFATDARQQLFAGMKIAAQAVTTTLGPMGKTVIIERPGHQPLVTKDGVTVAKAIRLSDPVQRMGAQLIIEAANQTNDVAGDGTTTATVLTFAMVEAGLKLVASGHNSLRLCKGISATTGLIIEELKRHSRPVQTSEEITQVGTISANGDAQIGQLIADAMARVGRDGIITVEDAKGMATTLDVVEGMQFDRGYVSPYFVTDNERMKAVYHDACVVVTDKKLTAFKDIHGILELIARNQKSLLIIADDFEGEALQGLVLNRVKGNLPVVAIKAPGYGQHRQELLHDICVMTGATLVSAANGHSLDKVTLTQLGQCKRVAVDAKSTLLVGPGTTKAAVDKHVDELRAQLQDVTLSSEDAFKLKTRAARLAAGVAVIRVGGATEVEMIERKFRVEDALNATKAATDEGIVPGGGMALFNAVNVVKEKVLGVAVGSTVDPDEWAGANIVYEACLAPLKKIVGNTAESPSVVVNELTKAHLLMPTMSDGHGYNALTGEYGDLFEMGIVDPVKVSRTALKNAASVAITFLTLDAVIHNEPTHQLKERSHDDV